MIRCSHLQTFLFLILISLLSVAHGEVELSPQPDWIEKRPTIEAQTIDPKRNSYSHSVLLLDSQVRLLDAGLRLVRAVADRRIAFASLEATLGEKLR